MSHSIVTKNYIFMSFDSKLSGVGKSLKSNDCKFA